MNRTTLATARRTPSEYMGMKAGACSSAGETPCLEYFILLAKKKNTMKNILISLALAVVAPFAWAQVSETTTTTTTTGNGTITEYTPGSTIVLKETSGPRTYHFGKTVTYVTRSGKVLDEDTVRTRVKVGIPVRVHYVGTGDNVMVDRVTLDED